MCHFLSNKWQLQLPYPSGKVIYTPARKTTQKSFLSYPTVKFFVLVLMGEKVVITPRDLHKALEYNLKRILCDFQVTEYATFQLLYNATQDIRNVLSTMWHYQFYNTIINYKGHPHKCKM